MERFYGTNHAVELTNEAMELLLRSWRASIDTLSDTASETLQEWLEERVTRRAAGTRGFRIAPAPEPINDHAVLERFSEVVRTQCVDLTSGESAFLGLELDGTQRVRWLGKMLDVLGFIQQARELPFDHHCPTIPDDDRLELTLRRMWERYTERARTQDMLFPEDPAYPDTRMLLGYLDRIVELAVSDGREERREWPFPKALWERERLLEKLGQFDELADTMRRSAALEDETFRQQTEAYIAALG